MNYNLLTILALIASLFSCSKTNNDCEAVIIKDCFHTEEYNPVCGCDNKTYVNASAANCSSITDFTQGACVIDLSKLKNDWEFLGYAIEGAKLGNKAKFHPYTMSIKFTNIPANSNLILDGKSSINQFAGLYSSAETSSIKVKANLTTKIAGTLAALEYEDAFIRNLNLSNSFKVQADYLELSRFSLDQLAVSPLIFKKK